MKSQSLANFVECQTIPEQFSFICDNYPDSIAIKTMDNSITYGQLEDRAGRVAHSVLKHATSASNHVIISLDKDEDMLAAMFGTLMAGKAYVPFDSGYGETWSNTIINDVCPSLIITDRSNYIIKLLADKHQISVFYMDDLLADLPLEREYYAATPESVASILYTSGSTGEPKGVMQNHQNILFHVRLLTDLFKIGPEDKHTLLPSYIHDASTTDIFCTLLNGATLYPFKLKRNGFLELSSYLQSSGITLYHSTPTVFRELVNCPANETSFLSLRLIIVGGEPVRKEDVISFRKLFPKNCLFVNGYGATETSGFVALNILDRSAQLDEGGVIPIGTAPPGIHLILVDEHKVPVSQEGEIAVECNHIALGYLNKAESTKKVYGRGFTSPESRVYFTGDYGYMTASGKIQLIGRKDRQMKIRGNRIDMAEIESALAEMAAVKQVAVCAEQYADQSELLAYLVLNKSEMETGMEYEIRSYLAKRLPDYMAPSKLVFLSELPMTRTNKVDYIALASQREVLNVLSEQATVSSTDTLEIVWNIWKKILRNSAIALDDHLVDRGASSLHVMKAQSAVHELLQRKIPLIHFFEYPTIQSFVDFMEHGEQNTTFNSIEARMRRRD
ncbi:AMP-binding protein [Paenibacillus polysaccharolyticus]|uniref:non-ribosomal peptide synthetase n=1 Tax=Paenibacillus polysaccharolyticus TaxID=582692 RepID=UPI00203BDCE6|nr:AMP-binding protein [Paenibacillus polysaccharolyticus]MCM3132898.1 AMP-binding protein [Paenibacillus polysaccharolyticus]